MDIRQAKDEDFYSVKSIWLSSFEDDGKYFDFYAKHAYHPEWTWLVFDGDLAVSMMTVMPCVAWNYGKVRKGSYIYAVATLPEYRHRGLMTLLHQKVEQICRQNSDSFLTLVPASPSLFGMYEGLGYETCSWLYQSTFELEQRKPSTADISFSEAQEDAFVLLRLEYLKSFCNSAALAVNDFTYTYRELLVAGYSICMVQSDDLNGYLVYRMDEKKRLLIRETNLSKECYEEIMSSFIDKMGAASLCIKTAEPWFDQADKISYSMIKCLDTCNESKQYYMNLMLDD